MPESISHILKERKIRLSKVTNFIKILFEFNINDAYLPAQLQEAVYSLSA